MIPSNGYDLEISRQQITCFLLSPVTIIAILCKNNSRLILLANCCSKLADYSFNFQRFKNIIFAGPKPLLAENKISRQP